MPAMTSLAAAAVLLLGSAHVSPNARRQPFAATDLAITVRSADIDLGEVSALEGASLRSRALSMTVRSPGRWRLTVRSEADFRGTTGRAIPSERLKLRVTGGPFLSLSRSQTVTLATGRETTPAGDPVDLDLRLDVAWDDPPGAYTGVLLLTLMPEP